MAISNNNLKMIDRPIWEQLTNSPGNSAAGVSMDDDNDRFVYVLLSATSFWRYCTYSDTWQQLANPPSGTLGAGSSIRYVNQMGGQVNGVSYGSIYAMICSGAAVVFYRYDIATNTWSTALSVTNVPAAWGTEGCLLCPDPILNGNTGGYHTAVALNTITTTSIANVGATTIAVTALPLALPIGARINFGTVTTPIYAVLTATASASATSITVSALPVAVPSASVGYFYNDMFLVGNNATVMYRYNITGNAWTTTSANSANPALPAVTGTIGAGAIFCWLPGSGDTNALNRFVLVRGTATSSIYEYDIATNTWSTLTYYPFTETFNAGTCGEVVYDPITRKMISLLIQKDNSGRMYKFDRLKLRLDPVATQNLILNGASVVGQKLAGLYDPTGSVYFVYNLLNTSAYFLRTPLIPGI